jgi:diguanylate cyclase (GGDEF)-like protein
LELNLDLDLSLISRFGGEEFCILISNISIEESRERFEKILTTFEENIINIDESTKLSFTVSIGICYGLKDSLEDMIKTADSALYHCKNSGRNQISIINNSIQP